MKKLLFIILTIFVSFLFVGAGEEPETIWCELPSMVFCEPRVLKKGEILNISLGPNHGKELAIRRHSDDVWYFLVVGSPPADMVSLMTPSEFSKAKSFKIGPKTTGYKWTYEGGNEIIFSEPGMYTIYVSEVLESEIGGYICHVTAQNH